MEDKGLEYSALSDVEQLFDYKSFVAVMERHGVHMSKDMFWKHLRNGAIQYVEFGSTAYVKQSEVERILKEGI